MKAGEKNRRATKRREERGDSSMRGFKGMGWWERMAWLKSRGNAGKGAERDPRALQEVGCGEGLEEKESRALWCEP